MTNIISIKPILTDTIYNVIKVIKYHYLGETLYKAWYQPDEIEIWKDEDKTNETN